MLHSICKQIWKTQQWPQGWKTLILIPIPKKGSTKECSSHQTVAFISQTSKVILKIQQARLQQYVNWELPDVQTGLRKGRGTRSQIANIHRILKKTRKFQKSIYLCFIDYAKAFDCVERNKLWKTLKEMRIPDHLTCLLRNLYASQQATFRTLYRKTGGFGTKKSIWQGYLWSPRLFNLYAEHTMWKVGLGKLQAEIKIVPRNINNFWYAEDTTLIEESKEELNSLLMRMKESEKAGLKLDIKKTKIMASSLITSRQVKGEKMEAVTDFLSLV